MVSSSVVPESGYRCEDLPDYLSDKARATQAFNGFCYHQILPGLRWHAMFGESSSHILRACFVSVKYALNSGTQSLFKAVDGSLSPILMSASKLTRSPLGYTFLLAISINKKVGFFFY